MFLIVVIISSMVDINKQCGGRIFANYNPMNSNMLLSLVTMKLSDEKQRLTDLCQRYQLQPSLLLARLAERGGNMMRSKISVNSTDVNNIDSNALYAYR